MKVRKEEKVGGKKNRMLEGDGVNRQRRMREKGRKE